MSETGRGTGKGRGEGERRDRQEISKGSPSYTTSYAVGKGGMSCCYRYQSAWGKEMMESEVECYLSEWSFGGGGKRMLIGEGEKSEFAGECGLIGRGIYRD